MDIAIITIREDEERAILQRMEPFDLYEGGSIYAIATIPVDDDENPQRTIAEVRCTSDGEAAAQALASEIIQDLKPASIFVVGIGGCFPSSEYSLGDVIVATRIQDLRLMALLQDKEPQFDVRSKDVEPEVERVVTAIQRLQLKGWDEPEAIGLERPLVSLSPDRFYGPDQWKASAKKAMAARFRRGGSQADRPHCVTGALISTDSLVKDATAAQQWLTFVRKAIGCEMETAGVFQAARTRKRVYPVYGIRGISDMVGFKRDEKWTAYACQSAASFTFALIRSGWIPGKRRSSRSPEVPKAGRSTESSAKVSDSPIFRAGQHFIDRGEAESAVATMLAGTPYHKAGTETQISIAAVWQKFGFVQRARKCLELLTTPPFFSRMTPLQQTQCRVIQLKVESQSGAYHSVLEASKPLLRSLARLELDQQRAAVYRRIAIAHAALGDGAAARRVLAKTISMQLNVTDDHSRATARVFEAITLALGTGNGDAEAANATLRDAAKSYLASPLDRSEFQANPLKSAVMCLFSEAAIRLVRGGESPAAWICLTASYVLATRASAHPDSEGYAELLALLRSRPSYFKMFRMAMSSDGANRGQVLERYSQISRYLGKCQDLPDLAEGRTEERWIAMRRRLDQVIAEESRG